MAINIVNNQIHVTNCSSTEIFSADSIDGIKKNQSIYEYKLLGISNSVYMQKKQLKVIFKDYFSEQSNAPYDPYLLDLMRILSWIESDVISVSSYLRNEHNINI